MDMIVSRKYLGRGERSLSTGESSGLPLDKGLRGRPARDA